MRIKSLAQGENILMLGFEPSTFCIQNRHSNHYTNCSTSERRKCLSDGYLITKKVSSGEANYMINDIIVKQIIFSALFIVHSLTLTCNYWNTAFIMDSHCYDRLLSFFPIIFLNSLLMVVDIISAERLFHILMPLSNIEFLDICGLCRGNHIERLLQVSYMWYE